MRSVYYFDKDPYPRDYIDDLPDSETANIDLRLEVMCSTPPHEWPWVDHVEGKLWKLNSGPHRLFYCLYLGDIVVLHAVRKRGRRLRRKDINLALKRLDTLEGE